VNEAELANRFRLGEEAAIREVYRRYSGPVFTVARSLLNDRDQAADAVQQTFLQAWRAAGSFDPARPLAPWLYAIARRVAIDMYRKNRRTVPTTSNEEVHDIPVTQLSFERSWEAWEIRQAVDQLPDEEKQVVRLQHFEGLTHSQIADRLGIALGTVKSRSHRAHQRLARDLIHLVEVTS
jgi:RNA polymerase sigma-70 factor (ECF subfamily)